MLYCKNCKKKKSLVSLSLDVTSWLVGREIYDSNEILEWINFNLKSAPRALMLFCLRHRPPEMNCWVADVQMYFNVRLRTFIFIFRMSLLSSSSAPTQKLSWKATEKRPKAGGEREHRMLKSIIFFFSKRTNEERQNYARISHCVTEEKRNWKGRRIFFYDAPYGRNWMNFPNIFYSWLKLGWWC